MTTNKLLWSAFFLSLMFIFSNPIFGNTPGNGNPDPLPNDGTEIKLDTNDSNDIMYIWSITEEISLADCEEIVVVDKCKEIGDAVFGACIQFWPGGFPKIGEEGFADAALSCTFDSIDAENQCRK